MSMGRVKVIFLLILICLFLSVSTTGKANAADGTDPLAAMKNKIQALLDGGSTYAEAVFELVEDGEDAASVVTAAIALANSQENLEKGTCDTCGSNPVAVIESKCIYCDSVTAAILAGGDAKAVIEAAILAGGNVQGISRAALLAGASIRDILAAGGIIPAIKYAGVEDFGEAIKNELASKNKFD